MFNNQNFNNIKVNSVSGILIKSHPKSRFKRFHIKSGYADDVWNGRERIVPIQFMLCGEGQLLMEYVSQSDWDVDQLNG